MKIKKLLYSIILGIGAFISFSFADCIIYGPNNELLMMYACDEGTTEITLEGDWTKNGDNYTFNGGYDGTTVYYTDGYGNNRSTTVNSDLYFNGEYSIGYTGNQYIYLSNNQCGEYSGYTPVFDVTGSINNPTESGNIFNNFAENGLKVLLSNIPNYIQYIIMIFLLFFIIGIIKKIRR